MQLTPSGRRPSPSRAGRFSTIRPALITALGAIALPLSACAATPDPHAGGHHPTSTTSASTTPGNASHNAADVTFAQMMIPHHEQAIEMSDLVLTKPGIDSRVATLAAQISKAQAPEVVLMRNWLTAWGAPTSAGDHQGHADSGMLSRAELDELRDAAPDRAARLFLQGMIRHHQGAIAMARTQVATGSNADAKGLAQTIIDTQQREIDAMDALLKQL